MNQPIKAPLAVAIAMLLCAAPRASMAEDFGVIYSDQPSRARQLIADTMQEQSAGVTQLDLKRGGIASIVGKARYSISGDSTLTLLDGAVTIMSGPTQPVIVQLPNGALGRVPAGGHAARFSAVSDAIDMNVMNGRASLASANRTISLGTGGFATSHRGEAPRRVIAGDAQAVPGTDGLMTLIAGQGIGGLGDMQAALAQAPQLANADGLAQLKSLTGVSATQMWALALAALYEYVRAGNLPSEYSGGLSREQILLALDTLEANGDFSAFLGAEQAEFWQAYHAWLSQGYSLDAFPGLNSDPEIPPPPPVDGGGDTPIPPPPPPLPTTRTLNEAWVMTATNRPGNINGGVLYASSGPVSLKVRTKDSSPTGTNTLFNAGDLVIPENATLKESWSDGKGMYVGQLGSLNTDPKKFTVGANEMLLGSQQGMHYVYLPMLTNLPASGDIHYRLGFATKPSWDSGSLGGGIFDADMVVSFQGTVQRIGLVGSLDMPGDAKYTFTTAGGLRGASTLAPALMTPNRLQIPIVGNGRACPPTGSGCTLNVGYTIAGDQAGQVGIIYNTSAYGASEFISGAAGFVADGPYVPPPSASHPFANTSKNNLNMIGWTDFKDASFGIRRIGVFGSAKFDSNGAIIEAYPGGNPASIPMKVGTASVSDVGSIGGVLAWTRWMNPGMTKLDGSISANDSTATQSIMVVAVPFSAPTDATARYTLVGGIMPRNHVDGNVGTMSGNAYMSFGGSPTVGFDMTVTSAQGAAYRINTMGSMPTPNIPVAANGQFQTDALASNATMCGPNHCVTTLAGFVGGAGATHIGLSYAIAVGGLMSNPESLNGMAAFVKEGLPQVVTQDIGPQAPAALKIDPTFGGIISFER